MNTNQKGKITELEVLTYIIKKGYSVSIPYGDKDRYDQIWDIGGKMYRIQIKTARWLNDNHDCIVFNTRSTYTKANGNVTKNYTENDIDYFATYFNNQVYVVPINECGKTEKKLRYKTSLNNPHINWAVDYTFEKIFEK